MNREIKFKKGRILLGIVISAVMLLTSISFILTPENYLRNVFSKEFYIQIIGTITLLYSSSLFYSLISIVNKTNAIVITDSYLLDNSKYESLGKIKWSSISKIQQIDKRNIRIFVNKSYLKTNKDNPLKKFLRMMNNWNYKNSVIISSALLDIDINELFKSISNVHKKNK